MKAYEPELAEEYEKEILQKNDIDTIIQKQDYDTSEIKIYPGSINGPEPEDDPDAYTKWFVNNQPKKMFEKYTEKTDLSELGVKQKIV